MKALFLILGSMLLAASLSSADTKGLRRQGRDGDHAHGHGHHGAAQGGQARRNNRGGGAGGRRNNRRNNRRNQARQAFESGGYLAASDDYADEAPLAGYTEDSTTALPDYAEYDTTDSAAADDYAGPGGDGSDSAADPALGYDAPGADSADGYAAPGAGADYGAPGDETSTDIAQYDESLPGYDDSSADSLADYANGEADAGQAAYDPAAEAARQRRNRNGKSPATGNAFPFNAVRNNVKFCPGGKLDSCIAICPGGAARVYASCVTSCGNRCSIF
jgi:hypothetical protein